MSEAGDGCPASRAPFQALNRWAARGGHSRDEDVVLAAVAADDDADGGGGPIDIAVGGGPTDDDDDGVTIGAAPPLP
jgi:hypothetical protein